MGGDVASALREFRAQYDVGADPSVVLTDLADFNHLVTRIRFTPDVADDISLSEDERTRGRDFAEKLSIRVLSRTWQMLLKGITEVDNSSRPVQAAEMLLIRLAHAADLPTLDEALKSLEDGGGDLPTQAPELMARVPETAGRPWRVRGHGCGHFIARSGHVQRRCDHAAGRTVSRQARAVRSAAAGDRRSTPAVPVGSIEDIISLADKQRDMQFKIMVKNCVRLVSIKPGRLEINLTENAPKTLLTDLSQKLS